MNLVNLTSLSAHLSLLLASSIQPFSWNLLADIQQMLQFDFMRAAFLAGTAIALVAGLAGYFVVLRHQVFASDTLSHMVFAGAMGAALLGVNAFLGVYAVAISGGLALNGLGWRGSARERDIATGMVMAWMLGLGALLLGIYATSSIANGNTAIGAGVLFGSILGVAGQEWIIVIAGIVTILALLAMARPLLFASLDPETAQARGVPVRLLGALFLLLVGVSVAEAVPAVGALLIFALLVAPAAIAQRLVKRPYAALALSALLALLFTWLGLTLGFYTPYPVSFLITALAFVTYLLVVAAQRLRQFATRRRFSNSNTILTHTAGG